MIAVGVLAAWLVTSATEPPKESDAKPIEAVALDGAAQTDGPLAKAYEERLQWLREVRGRLDSGAELSSDEIASLLRDPADKERKALTFERRYLATLERVIREREALRREREADAASRSEGPEAGDAGDESEPVEIVTPVVTPPGDATSRLDDAQIRESLEPGALADLLYDLGRYEEALAAYESEPPGGPADRAQWAQYRKGQCLFEAGRLEEALTAYGKGLDEYPDGPWTELCRIAMDAIELDRAIARGIRGDADAPVSSDSSDTPDDSLAVDTGTDTESSSKEPGR